MKHTDKYEKIEAVCDFAPIILLAIYMLIGIIF